ncbi:MAG: hypothetical protein U0930_19760 [Pirellulales bacterium]
MTNQTLIASLLIGSTLAVVLGLIGRRFKQPNIASTIAFSLSVVLALPVLLGYWQEPQRLIAPREAVEWLSVGLFGLAIVTAIRVADKKRSTVWLSLGGVLSILVALRLMYGSVYLRAGSVLTLSSLLIVGWGLTIGVAWIQPLVGNVPRRKLDGALQLIGLLIVSANLGMSGSFKYAAVGLLCTLIALSAWLAGQALPSLVASTSLLILGLGPTFSETQWSVAMLLGVMVLLFGWLPSLEKGRPRWAVALAATLCLTIGSGLTIVKLREDISGQSKEPTGYEAYR